MRANPPKRKGRCDRHSACNYVQPAFHGAATVYLALLTNLLRAHMTMLFDWKLVEKIVGHRHGIFRGPVGQRSTNRKGSAERY